jgi:hypothetical protein
MKGLDPTLFSAVCTQAMILYKPKLFWKEATGETGQEDQTKEGKSIMTIMQERQRLKLCEMNLRTLPTMNALISTVCLVIYSFKHRASQQK